ncbi:MAG TPA: rhodanese-related sulfurtransferase [SAR86 cluster bacterium]|jgi:UPF0176 protein|nr:rhodanese-related sulfurtransferase [SAR86 cluster bacterium]HJM14954.1 rhodanese-related sulfurtransferase [SAR86 cluster bacterium]|tara:strand:+ start:87 stop:1007 length:921 start_codon:yes stop_codon:yes gene_type:complete
MSKYHVLTFYQIKQISDHEKLSRDVTRYATKNSLLGTFFSTPQGINTTMSGEREALKGLIELLENKFDLSLFNPKWSLTEEIPFKRLRVRLKPKLLPLEGNFDPVLKRGEHLNAEDWNKIISESDTIVIDVRNDYETDIGTFKNSIIPEMKDFTEFPDFVDGLKEDKKAKIAMFCTGGIRCEIASSFMMEKGFDEVYQLEGGVLNYLDTVNKEESLWEGECFVFDERVSLDNSLNKGKYVQCFGCRRPLSDKDLKSQHYLKGVSCSYCFDVSSEFDKERFAQRQKQIELAEARGHKHMGAMAKQKK